MLPILVRIGNEERWSLVLIPMKFIAILSAMAIEQERQEKRATMREQQKPRLQFAALAPVEAGMSFEKEGRLEEAERCYREALTLNPRCVSALAALSRLEEQAF